VKGKLSLNKANSIKNDTKMYIIIRNIKNLLRIPHLYGSKNNIDIDTATQSIKDSIRGKG
jgi:hypothetical protein